MQTTEREPTSLLTVTPRRRRQRIWERGIAVLLAAAAFSSVFVTFGIVATLVVESASFFAHVPLKEFFTDTLWTPLFAEPRYGILALVSGTMMTTLVALSIALPAGTIIAIYLSEFAPPRLREWVKPVLELLSAVPTVVYGYFALLVVSPFLQKFIPDLSHFSILSAGLVMGVMIIPYVSSLSEDAMRAVPAILREGSYALGASKLGTSLNVVFPAALSGIAASYVLAISRAVGETMIVAIAAGLQPKFTVNPLDSAATISAFIVQVSLGDLPHGSMGYQSIFAAGITLFAITLCFNIGAHWLRRRFREAY
ncbi:phosphate ABC transporter permease subunit PstC [Opitutales bacterium ASA1]|uniref:phosphate ABC transporter permease subunit PstC n=1 Tax=Congregicoccus parvus TaxID=3081749 RepID=UPI002B2C4226|nr:phosphate ABC transporter permease subunit PstC [Opitutales bacterium ASA1]